MITLEHGRVQVQLHRSASGSGAPLLLLHGLGGSSRDWGEMPRLWSGSVYALDFSGHGASAWLRGGGYTPELLAGDADAALAHIGSAAVAGVGLGAYVALLLAGARSTQVSAALLLPGPGLDGFGPQPSFSDPQGSFTSPPLPAAVAGCDPNVAVLELSIRPSDYAEALARHARAVLLAEDGMPRPPWWAAVRAAGGQPVATDVRAALHALAVAAAP